MERFALAIVEVVRSHRAELRFCLRVTVAGLAGFALGRSFAFPLHGLWAVLTAVVVTQVSVGGSFRATIEYIVGTVTGAIYAAAIGVLIPHTTAWSQAGVLALAIAPLALAAALSPSFRVAPFSGILVLLIGTELGESPIASALTRVLEVALGGVIAMVVSVLVLPERAQRLGVEAAARILRTMADFLPRLLSDLDDPLERLEMQRLHGELGRSLTAHQALVIEAKRERFMTLRGDQDWAPLSRTLVRLRHDLVILGRATAVPLPESVARRLDPLIARCGAEGSEFLRGCAAALADSGGPPSLAATDEALAAYQAEVAALRAEGLTRPMSTDEAERLFALGFAFEQLSRDFADLAQRLQEYGAGPPRPAPQPA